MHWWSGVREAGITATLAVLSNSEPCLKTFWSSIKKKEKALDIAFYWKKNKVVSGLDPAEVILIITGLLLIIVSPFALYH